MLIRPALPDDGDAVSALLDACFGPARGRRTAALLRGGRAPEQALVAVDGAELIGTVQTCAVELRPAAAGELLALLGPLAAAPSRRGEGIGLALMDAVLAAHDASGGGPVVLIGDAPYYARWDFSAAGTAGWALPGPVDRARLLVRGGGRHAVAGRLAAVAEPLSMAA